ncbi:MAG: RluA family pseudouridine synthase [Chitinophagaceae bacterium]|nr:RluA family pseudouridine synthase [Rubrivivax sp.]
MHACDTLLVLDKPAGLLAVPGRGEAGRDNLASRVQGRFADALVVHRLDQATSGLMLFARGLAMQALLNKAFAQRAVHKNYVALVEGCVAADQGQIDAPLAADWPRRPRQQVDHQHGKASLTHWSVLARDDPPRTTRLLLKPITGRSHQLRVHLLHIGHPIRGDGLYAPEPLQAPRLMLHATRLQLHHPVSDALLVFDSPVPF